MNKRSILAAAVVLASIAVGASPVAAKGGDVGGSATCTSGVKAKIKAGPRDPGQIKTNIQIDDVGLVAQAWTITVADGAESLTFGASTAGLSNSIDSDAFTGNGAGADTVTFTASRAGASCSGSVTVP